MSALRPPLASEVVVLVLSRKVGESIVIGGDVVVTVLGVRGEVIRLGIDAPKNVVVHRSEVVDAIAVAEQDPDAP
jgi:carbon storage regulator